MNSYRHLVFACALFLGLLSACSTPKNVRTLADRTAANVGVISAQLDRLAQESRQLADLRAANIAQLHAANTAGRANYTYDLALTMRSGGQANLDLISLLEAWVEEVNAIFDSADMAEKQRKEAILATQQELDTKSEALAEIAQALATLAKKESVTRRITFLAGYARQLKTDVTTQLDQSNRSATEAKALLSKLKKSNF